jgi:hypothetical protein
MAEKVYGIAESKSKVEVPRKADVYSKSETYSKSECYSKSETYSQSQSDTNFLRKTDGAPKNHASTADTYGLGTSEMFGHCMLVNSFNAPSGNQDGKALSAAAGYALKSAIDSGDAALHQEINGVRLPIGSVYWSESHYASSAAVDAIIGYGNWTYRGFVALTYSVIEETKLYAYIRYR